MPIVFLHSSAVMFDGCVHGYLYSYDPIPYAHTDCTVVVGSVAPDRVEVPHHAAELSYTAPTIARRLMSGDRGYRILRETDRCSDSSSASSSARPAVAAPPSSAAGAPSASGDSGSADDDTAQERANDEAIAAHDEMLDSGFRSVNPAVAVAHVPTEADRLLGHPQSIDRFDWQEIAERMQAAEWIGAGLKHRTRKVILPWPEGDRVYSVDNLDEIAKESALRGWESRFGDAGIEIIERKPFRD